MPRGTLIWAILLLLATVAFGVSPWLLPGFNGFEADQFPIPQDTPPDQPEGYAFAIWGVIYLWLVVHAVFGLLKRRNEPDWQASRPALTLSVAVGAAWLPVAVIAPLAATILIWIMLAGALKALATAPALDRWYARAPIGFYAGWLTAAASVALGFVLGGYGILSPLAAAYLSLALALIIGIGVLLALPDIAEYGLSLAWALVAVAVQNGTNAPAVTGIAAAGALMSVALAWRSSAR